MKSVMNHAFSQAPTIDTPRSVFDRSHAYKTTLDAGLLVPVYWDEVLPGDTVTLNPSLFARMATPVYPLMDNLFLDIHFFFVPYRQLWTNFRKFCGEQVDPGDSIDFTLPYLKAPASTGFSEGTLFDYLGIPTKVPDLEFSALPYRAYFHIFNEWYRDQNLVDSRVFVTGDQAGAVASDQFCERRGKRHDYFTSCLPFLQKGDAVSLPLGTRADVKGIGIQNANIGTPHNEVFRESGNTTSTSATGWGIRSDEETTYTNRAAISIQESTTTANYPDIYADLTNATAASINQIRQAFQIQKLLERDARSGTRYAEIVNSHFGVKFLDVTYRPEFLGGGTTVVNMQSVPQTSETTVNAPQGNLAAFGTTSLQGGGFTKSFTEHGIVMGIVSVRADLTYQQGLDRAWSRRTRYDMYWPALAHIGEQAVLVKELYAQDPAIDTGSTGTPDNERVFGYQERWAEYRYKPSRITGAFRSNHSGTLDAWHLSQEFSSLPSLNSTFIQETPPMARVTAVPSEPDFILDCWFDQRHARAMPTYSVPGLIDHF